MNSLQHTMKLNLDSSTKSTKLPSNILKALYSIKDYSPDALGSMYMSVISV